MKESFVIGVDIGGTKIGTGVVSSESKVIASAVLPTPSGQDPEAVLQQIYKSVDEALIKAGMPISSIIGIGVVAPGPLDQETGVIISAPNIPSFQNVSILGAIRGRYGLPAMLENDANAAGLAEALFGAGVDSEHVLYVTVSTGIGTGIIFNKEIYHGKNGVAAEGGHVTIDYQGPLCSCGMRGCIEAFASGTALTRRAKQKLTGDPSSSMILDLVGGDTERISPVVITRAAVEGDELAQSLIQETGQYLGIWLGSMVSLLDPDVVIIGGGLSSIGGPLFDVIRQTLPRHTINPFAKDISVVPAQLKRNVGILGAAALFLSRRQ